MMLKLRFGLQIPIFWIKSKRKQFCLLTARQDQMDCIYIILQKIIQSNYKENITNKVEVSIEREYHHEKCLNLHYQNGRGHKFYQYFEICNKLNHEEQFRWHQITEWILIIQTEFKYAFIQQFNYATIIFSLYFCIQLAVLINGSQIYMKQRYQVQQSVDYIFNEMDKLQIEEKELENLRENVQLQRQMELSRNANIQPGGQLRAPFNSDLRLSSQQTNFISNQSKQVSGTSLQVKATHSKTLQVDQDQSKLINQLIMESGLSLNLLASAQLETIDEGKQHDEDEQNDRDIVQSELNRMDNLMPQKSKFQERDDVASSVTSIPSYRLQEDQKTVIIRQDLNQTEDEDHNFESLVGSDRRKVQNNSSLEEQKYHIDQIKSSSSPKRVQRNLKFIEELKHQDLNLDFLSSSSIYSLNGPLNLKANKSASPQQQVLVEPLQKQTEHYKQGLRNANSQKSLSSRISKSNKLMPYMQYLANDNSMNNDDLENSQQIMLNNMSRNHHETIETEQPMIRHDDYRMTQTRNRYETFISHNIDDDQPNIQFTFNSRGNTRHFADDTIGDYYLERQKTNFTQKSTFNYQKSKSVVREAIKNLKEIEISYEQMGIVGIPRIYQTNNGKCFIRNMNVLISNYRQIEDQTDVQINRRLEEIRQIVQSRKFKYCQMIYDYFDFWNKYMILAIYLIFLGFMIIKLQDGLIPGVVLLGIGIFISVLFIGVQIFFFSRGEKSIRLKN
ncbi:UNKNOWN [Stylonychia lemnae]|uniref:Uncharacterized protein n=1 Tax=Stylonychia lemnae TaxID=5949 RepID=A0A078AI51_STYLE|nr:UNKNOWN [Stylonychia lemnae]|eukprot:CDW81884.1 UNKNOWN [Stylonychia lemnae]